MATRIDIEITSERGDGVLTWRQAGAKQPKGVMERRLLPDGCIVGDTLRAEVEFTVDGPEIVATTSIKEQRRETSGRIQIVGSGRSNEGRVTTELVKKPRGRGQSGRRGRRDPATVDARRGRSTRRQGLRPDRARRRQWLESLPETRRPIAEQLMHEGRVGVESALKRQNASADSQGRETIDVSLIMSIVSELEGPLAAAEWLDHCDAALREIDKADLREVRKLIVTASDHPDSEPVRQGQDSLRNALNARQHKEQEVWSREIRQALSDGRVVRALRQSGRPPKAGVPLASDLVSELSSAALEALDPEEEPERWSTVLEALAGSPVRRLVAPVSKPIDSDPGLLRTVERVAERIPAIADLYQIKAKRRRGR